MIRRDFDTTESALVKVLFPMHGAKFCQKWMPNRSLHSIQLYAYKNGIRRDSESLSNQRISRIPQMNQVRLQYTVQRVALTDERTAQMNNNRF
jgi:hypothetical protein